MTLTLAAVILSTASCSWLPKRSAKAPSRLEKLESYLTGSFSSAQQAASNDEYYDIALNMVPIWESRDDGPWLYVEQAVAQAADRPYRQRVYKLRENKNGTYESVVYELPDPVRFVNAYTDPDALDAIHPDDLTKRKGCVITMTYNEEDGTFVGSTDGRDCKSTLRGASYATSEVVLGPETLLTWDRGYSRTGEQVWGATSGGYVFNRVY